MNTLKPPTVLHDPGALNPYEIGEVATNWSQEAVGVLGGVSVKNFDDGYSRVYYQTEVDGQLRQNHALVEPGGTLVLRSRDFNDNQVVVVGEGLSQSDFSRRVHPGRRVDVPRRGTARRAFVAGRSEELRVLDPVRAWDEAHDPVVRAAAEEWHGTMREIRRANDLRDQIKDVFGSAERDGVMVKGEITGMQIALQLGRVISRRGGMSLYAKQRAFEDAVTAHRAARGSMLVYKYEPREDTASPQPKLETADA